MKITQTPLIVKAFTIELNENELKLLGLIVGEMTVPMLEKLSAGVNYDIRGVVFTDKRFAHNLYNNILDALK